MTKKAKDALYTLLFNDRVLLQTSTPQEMDFLFDEVVDVLEETNTRYDYVEFSETKISILIGERAAR